MDDVFQRADERPESEAERARRLANEAILIQEARDDFAKNGGIPAEEVFAWLYSLPRPKPRKST